MPEYVYALHDFQPEHDDEVSFKTGERIEVIEKDDAYGDGWWQGRNLSGKVGLFPQSYTTPNPPADSVATATSTKDDEDDEDEAHKPSQGSNLPSLDEESERESPVPKAPAIYVNGNEPDGEMMRATMTDVQQAIEQLGRPRSNSVDEDRSFSFASSRHTDTDIDNDTDTDLDVDEGDVDAGEWHKGARQRLAEKARKAVEEAEKLEAMMGERSSAPPIAVELSDESEGEEEDELGQDYTKSSSYFRRHSRIPEEDEEEEEPGRRPQSPIREEELIIPEREETEAQTATATRTTFPVPSPEPATVTNDSPSPEPAPVTTVRSLPTPVSPGFALSSSPSVSTVTPTPAPPSPAPAPGLPTERKHDSNPHIGLPSPTASSTSTTPFHFSAPTSENSVSSAPSSSVLATPTPSAPDKTSEKEKTHPSEWTVDDVIDWLKSKGFDQDVCEKFTEQEITGDVLLDLDVNVLKNEIGIMAFGKRVRIANAITELKRPPSINYPDGSNGMNGPPSPLPGTPSNQSYAQYLQHSPQAFSAQSPLSGSFTNTHSRNQSVAQSHHSFPGSITGGVAGSTKDSYSVHSAGGGLFTGAGGELTSSPLSAEVGKVLSSPSDSALAEKAEGEGDEFGALSEGEGNAASQRRRLFGRSHDSAASDGKKSSRHSKDGAAEDKKDEEKEGSPSTARHRPKKSIDGKTGEHSRLSIFGGTFTGSLGKQKHRKPPPRYSTYEEGDATTNDKSASGSAFHLPKFSTGPRKVSSGRPGSSSGLKGKEGETKETRDPALLRKRTSSYPGPGSASSQGSKEKDKDKAKAKDTTNANEEKEKKVDMAMANGHGKGEKGGAGEVQSPLKPGQSILDQIGEPDHSGWMKKKGDRYNSWKLRYFVLKGHHLYCLKSDSHSETKIKGYVNIVGYKVTVDENVNPGKYGFRIDHEHDKTHYFSSEEKNVIRDWMKAIMKATIGRDYTKPVISSFNAPTIPLMVAQAMNPAPRPPSPTAREATQKALRRENPNQLSSRDARILMGLPGSETKDERARLDSFFSNQTVTSEKSKETPKGPVPPRPSREGRRSSVTQSIPPTPSDDNLFEWANGHLPSSLQINPNTEPLCGGLALLRIAESIKGRAASPPVSDSAFPRDLNDEKLDGFFRLFDFLLDNDVKMGSVSINDVRTGKRDKVIQLLKALKAWEDKRRAIAQSIGKGSVQAGPFIAGV